MASSKAFEGLDVTADEVDRIEKALKNEEFRKLFVEYAQEIADPENRKKYEAELAEMERSRGMDVKFLHPKPGYVLKTSIDGEKKAFINICQNENIGKPQHAQATKAVQGSGGSAKVGLQWSMPYSLAPGREDIDHAGKKCMVYDCIFHPDCFDMITKDRRFRKLMDDSALDGIEREFKVKLDRNNVKKPKMKFKGSPQATIIRTPNKEGPTGGNAFDAMNVPYPYDAPKEVEKHEPSGSAKSATKISGNRNAEVTCSDEKKVESNGFTIPKYSITHRGHFDIQQFTNARDSMPSTRPQELILKVELPLLKSAATVQLDVFEKRVFLECKKPASYRLDLPLPYPVDEEKGSAKFDKSKSSLIITLSVLPPEIPKISSPDSVQLPNGNQSPLVQEISSVLADDLPDVVAMDTGSGDDVKVSHLENGKREEEREQIDGGLEAKVGAEEPSPIAKEPLSSTEAASLQLPDGITENGVNLQKHEKSETTESSADDVTSQLPCYNLYQSKEHITVIFREKGIDGNSFTTQVFSGGKVLNVEFLRTKENQDEAEGDCSGSVYSFLLELEEGHTVEEEVKSSISEINAVVTLVKKEGCGDLCEGARVGVKLDALKKKSFLTEKSLDQTLEDASRDPWTAQEEVLCTVTEFSADSVKAEFQVTNEVPKQEDTTDVSEAQGKESPAGSKNNSKASSSSKPAESMIPALDLRSAAEAPRADSDTSGSPHSEPLSSHPDSARFPGLKSALRSPRRRASKSVSFSEEVLVELFLEGPKRNQKSGGKKNKGGRRGYVGPRRRIEKLKDNSWASLSDSELLNRNGTSTEEEDEQDGSQWDWRPEHALVRQSSSESESGQSGQEFPNSPRSKGKKSKGSRQRRKEKARREAGLATTNGVDHSDSNENDTNLKDADRNEMSKGGQLITEVNGNSELDKGTVEVSQKEDDVKNNNEGEDSQNGEELPLELQDHKTKCAFEFSNQVIFDLDE